MKRRIRNFSLRKKMIVYCYAVVAPILLVISILLTYRNFKSNRYDEATAQAQSVQSLEDSIDALRSDMQNLCTYLCINEDITAILKSDDTSGLNQNFQIWTDEAPMDIVLDMIALKGYIKTLAIYPENGVNPYLRCLDSTSYVGDIEAVRGSAAYQQAVESKGGIHWRLMPKGRSELYESSRTEKIVLCREIYDLSKKKKLGFMALGADYNAFYELCGSAIQDESESVVIFTPQGEALFSYGESGELDLQGLQSALSQTGSHGNGSFAIQDYDVFWAKNEKKSLMVCKALPRATLGNMLGQSLGTPLILLVVLLFSLYPVFLILSEVINKPLERLTAAMEKFQKGDFTQKIEIESQDELGMVSEGFNRMVEDIKRLIDENYVMALKEKESEWSALQSQINPHFLYNTLDTLYWKALDCENEEIAEDVLALSNLFRLVLGQGKGIIEVRDEIRLIEAYLHIQQLRFTRRLDYEIRVEDDILSAMIPKLILQPFVENAVVHGFEQLEKKCMLTVEGHRLPDTEYMEFAITDTGRGMSQEQLDDIFTEEESYRKQRVGHYAIRNVRDRLELKYHDKFRLDITSRIGEGTCVRIRIPLDVKKEKGNEPQIIDCRR